VTFPEYEIGTKCTVISLIGAGIEITNHLKSVSLS